MQIRKRQGRNYIADEVPETVFVILPLSWAEIHMYLIAPPASKENIQYGKDN